jgi:hypothetical protein
VCGQGVGIERAIVSNVEMDKLEDLAKVAAELSDQLARRAD